MRNNGWWFCGLLAVGFVFGLAWGACGQDRDSGHAQHHDKYRNWMQPGGHAGCCNERKTENGTTTGDCSPAESKIVNGSWVARRPDGSWVDIPDARIIRERNPGSEDGHLCYNYGKVLCFVPPDTGG